METEHLEDTLAFAEGQLPTFQSNISKKSRSLVVCNSVFIWNWRLPLLCWLRWAVMVGRTASLYYKTPIFCITNWIRILFLVIFRQLK